MSDLTELLKEWTAAKVYREASEMNKHDALIARMQRHGIRVDPECVTESGQLLDEAIDLLEQYGRALERIVEYRTVNAHELRAIAKSTIEVDQNE